MPKFKVKYIIYKIVSFILALILWLTIKNNIDPIIKASVTLPISIVNADKVDSMGKSYNVLGSNKCEINYIVEENKKDQVRSIDFEAYVDLADLINTEHLNIYVKPASSIKEIVNDIKVTPKTLHVVLDDVKTKEVEVKYIFKNKLDNNHSIENIKLSPEKIWVSGSNTKMNELSYIEIEIPINNLSENINGVSKVNLISKEGKVLNLNDYDLETLDINYSVIIYTNGNIQLSQPTEGKVDSSVNLDSVIINPSVLPVQGKKSILEKAQLIELPLINIDGIKETEVKEVFLKDILPVDIKCDLYDKVTVTINVSNIDDAIEPTAKAREEYQISSVVRE